MNTHSPNFKPRHSRYRRAFFQHSASSIQNFLLLFTLALSARAHDPLMDLPAPTSPGEAWNIITQSMANIDKCLQTNQLKEITAHVANCSPAIRLLQAEAKKAGKTALVDELEKLYYTGDAIITATRLSADASAKARLAMTAHQEALAKVAAQYDPELLKTQVYACPMHPLERSLDPAAPCAKCGMKLLRRRIPASTNYEKPGEPSMKLVATPDAPLRVGQKASVTISLTRNDGQPVTRKDLLTMHTEKIHLLIIDGSLSDYHHEHPAPAEKPGEYVFSFTPAKPGKYRIFADVVPAETSVQEYVIGDIAAEGTALPIEKGAATDKSEADGFSFHMKLKTSDGKVAANIPVDGELTVIGPDGQPFKQLEPVMAAFAHLVAFNEDGKTVLHIHPEGAEPQKKEDRGGPVLNFKLYAPKPGFYRLYAQTQILEGQVFAPFNLVVEAGSK